MDRLQMHGLTQFVQFVGREFAEFACGQVAELNLAVAYALEVADFVTDGSHHAADFTVLAFDKHKFCKSVFEVDVCSSVANAISS